MEAAINDPSLRAVFDALEINAADAWALFQQLDSVAQLKKQLAVLVFFSISRKLRKTQQLAIGRVEVSGWQQSR